MFIYKKIVLCFLLSLFSIGIMAQKEVSLVVSGEGSSKKEATDNALRSAIEQAFGSFVSSNTMIINDELLNDNIATFSKGTVKKFQEISSIEANGTHYVTLNATVSTEKLVSYVQAKGGTCELAGATFTANLRMLQFHRESTRKTVINLIKQLAILAPHVYDISIEPHPQSNGEVKLNVKFKPNKNMFEYDRLILTTLEALSISSAEKKSLEDMGEKDNLGYCTIFFNDEHDIIQYSKTPELYDRDVLHRARRNLAFYCPIIMEDSDILNTVIYQCLIKDNFGNVYKLKTFLSDEIAEKNVNFECKKRSVVNHFNYHEVNFPFDYNIYNDKWGGISDYAIYGLDWEIEKSITISYTIDELAKLTGLEVVQNPDCVREAIKQTGERYRQGEVFVKDEYTAKALLGDEIGDN